MSIPTDDEQRPPDAFDLNALLWGDLPIVGDDSLPDAVAGTTTSPIGTTTAGPVRAPNGAPPTSPAAAYRYPSSTNGTDDDTTTRVIAEPVPIPNESATLTLESDDGDANYFPDDLFLELPDLDALLALNADEADDDALDQPALPLWERELGLAALTERLEREVLPRLRRYIASRDYLTLGDLCYAVAMLQGSEVHLAEVRAFVQRSNVPVLPSRAHHSGVRDIPLATYEQTKRLFNDLLRGEPNESVVIERLCYAGLDLSEGTRRFLMQAWIGHCLSRAEERAFTEVIAAEIVRVGDDARRWSADALAAREALILDNLWLVSRMTRKYIGQGVEIDDLHQMGALGLFRAVELFDPTRVDRFVKYANG